MKKSVQLVMVAALVTVFFLGHGRGQTLPPPKTEQLLSQGAALYGQRCAPCHGTQGDGQSPMAKILDPPPRDFTRPLGQWARSGGEPQRVFGIIQQGIPGTAMAGFKLPEEDTWALVYTVMAFSRKGE